MAQGVARRGVLVGGLAAGAAVGLSTGGSVAAAADRRPAGLALTGVTVVDPGHRTPRPNMTVLISGHRIVAVGGNGQVRIPPETRVLDLNGKHLIPGLCEMHAHSIGSEEISPPLYLANGVTTVREMAGSAVVRAWRDRVERGQLMGPRWIIASSIIDGFPSLLVGPDEEPSDVIPVTTAAEARRAVRQVKAEGADFVKVYSRVPQVAYAAIAEEARRQGLAFAGHSPDLVPIEHAVRSGHGSIEHLHTVLLATSNRQRAVRTALENIRIQPGDYRSWFRQIHPIEWLAATSHSPGHQDAILAQLVANRTRVTPTVTMHKLVDLPEEALVNDERLKYIPAETREFWRFVLEDYYQAGRTAEEISQQRELYPRRLRFVKAMQEAGVGILAGSEAGFVYSYPGFTLHDELVELVRAGLRPLQALRAATTEAAEFLGLGRTIGSIRPGYVADLVVLDRDPLIDIRNTQQIHAVVVRGRLIDRGRRQRMLADVAEAAAERTGVLPAAAGCFCHLPRAGRAQRGSEAAGRQAGP